LQRYLRWYTRRSPVPNKKIISWFIEVQTKVLAPFCPHTCEEIWERIGGEGFIAKAAYPTWDESLIANETIEKSEDFIRKVIDDTQEIITVASLAEAKQAYIYTSDEWKYKALQIATGKNMGDAMKSVMEDPEMRTHGKEVSRYIQKIVSERLVPSGVNESAVLAEAKEFIGNEIGLKVEVNSEFDPQNKKKHAIPGRPAIFIQS